MTYQGCGRSHARRLAPAVLRYVKHNPVDVLEFLFSVNARVVGQLHEKFATVSLDALLGRAFVVDDESKVMQARPIRAATATFGSLREMQQGEVHHAVRQRDGVPDGRLDFFQALEAKDTFIERSRLFQVRNLNSDMSKLRHDVLQGTDQPVTRLIQ